MALLACIIGALFILGLIDLHQRDKAQRLKAEKDAADREARKERALERYLAELRARGTLKPRSIPPTKNPSSN